VTALDSVKGLANAAPKIDSGKYTQLGGQAFNSDQVTRFGPEERQELGTKNLKYHGGEK
jgi:hypothetical protein